MVSVEMVMIVKKYRVNIDINNPKNYFEKWYSEVWHRRVGTESVKPGVLRPILIEEFKQSGGILRHGSSKFKVSFENEKDYTMFILRWA